MKINGVVHMSTAGSEPENQSRENTPPKPKGVLPFADRINTITSTDPWLWLAAGWRDLSRAPRYSLSIGAVFSGLGLLVTAGLYYLGVPYLIWPMAAGFILIAPVFCTGFYAISRCLEEGLEPSWDNIITIWRRHLPGVMGAGLALVFFMLIWIRIAALIYVVNFPHTSLSVRQIALDTLFTADGLSFISTGTTIGGVLAFFAFLVSAVSLQTIVDGKNGFIPAIMISVLAVFRNLFPMMVWAALIVLFTVAGLAVVYVGLTLTLPLIGHASWHAYKGVVRDNEDGDVGV
jgi:uncharacterized membrane protein